jgi:WhiB family redox-sensing transcriptional regulator
MRVPSDLYIRGACVGQETDLWFPGRGPTAAEEAKAVCAGCPVRKICLDYALEAEEEFGVWGGTTPTERKRMK